MFRIAATLCALVLATLVASGCGEDPKVAYQRDLRAVGARIERALKQLPSGQQTVSARDIRALSEALDEAADDLDDIDAPENVADAQRRFVRGLRGASAAYADLARELAAADTDAERADVFVSFATDDSIDSAFTDMSGAQETLAAAGFRLFRAPQVLPARAKTLPPA